MNTVTRDEFETVRELLASAARYAESSHQKLDQVTQQQGINTEGIAQLRGAQDRTQLQLDRLSQSQDRTQVQLDQLSQSQDRTQVQLDQLSQSQNRTQAQLDQLSVRMTQMSERVDSFVFEVQRLIGGQAERLNQLEGISERLEAILAYLVRKEGSGE